MEGVGGKARQSFEVIKYDPSIQGATDLEAATKTITGTSEPGTPTYTRAMTIPVPSDSRLSWLCACYRISYTIDSMTATSVFVRVYVDTQSGDYLIFNKTETTTGQKIYSVDVDASSFASVWALLQDGASHTLKICIWVNSGNAVFSEITPYLVAGTCSTTGKCVLSLKYTGFVQVGLRTDRYTTGFHCVKCASNEDYALEGLEIYNGTVGSSGSNFSPGVYGGYTDSGVSVLEKVTNAGDAALVRDINLTLWRLPGAEKITYAPGLQGNADLEAATKTITRTSEASGTGNADYSVALTLPAPSDARLIIDCICQRLTYTIDSMTTGTLNIRAYVDVQDSSHRIFNTTATTTGQKLNAVDCYSSSLATVFNLWKDGSSHTIYIFFWVTTSGNAVLSEVTPSVGVGSCVNGYRECLHITHNGTVQIGALAGKLGTGTLTMYMKSSTSATFYWDELTQSSTDTVILHTYRAVSQTGASLWWRTNVVTDLMYLTSMTVFIW